MATFGGETPIATVSEKDTGTSDVFNQTLYTVPSGKYARIQVPIIFVDVSTSDGVDFKVYYKSGTKTSLLIEAATNTSVNIQEKFLTEIFMTAGDSIEYTVSGLVSLSNFEIKATGLEYNEL